MFEAFAAAIGPRNGGSGRRSRSSGARPRATSRRWTRARRDDGVGDVGGAGGWADLRPRAVDRPLQRHTRGDGGALRRRHDRGARRAGRGGAGRGGAGRGGGRAAVRGREQRDLRLRRRRVGDADFDAYARARVRPTSGALAPDEQLALFLNAHNARCASSSSRTTCASTHARHRRPIARGAASRRRAPMPRCRGARRTARRRRRGGGGHADAAAAAAAAAGGVRGRPRVGRVGGPACGARRARARCARSTHGHSARRSAHAPASTRVARGAAARRPRRARVRGAAARRAVASASARPVRTRTTPEGARRRRARAASAALSRLLLWYEADWARPGDSASGPRSSGRSAASHPRRRGLRARERRIGPCACASSSTGRSTANEVGIRMTGRRARAPRRKAAPVSVGCPTSSAAATARARA